MSNKNHSLKEHSKSIGGQCSSRFPWTVSFRIVESSENVGLYCKRNFLHIELRLLIDVCTFNKPDIKHSEISMT